MKAFVKTKEGGSFHLQDVDEPTVNDNDVLIKVKCVGICGSDMPIFAGKRKVKIPFIAGHEFSGDIVQMGKDLRDFKIGQRVSASIVINCGQCHYCSMGAETMCDQIQETGITDNGAFAEYIAVPAFVVHPLPEEVTYEQGASVDPVASAYRAVMKCNLDRADTIGIIGPGPIGLYALQIIRAATEKRKIIMIGTRDNRLEIARQLGADFTINITKKSIDSIVQDISATMPVDTIIEAAGQVAAVNMALMLSRKSGEVVLAGIFENISEIDPSLIVRKELSVKGSLCYTKEEFSESLRLIASGKIDISKIITHRLPFNQIKEGIELIKAREAMKVCLFL